MKRISFLLTFLLLPSLAHAQFQHTSFFNGGTTLNATCTNTSGTVLSQDYWEGVLQGNTTVNLPPVGANCLSGDIERFKPTQAASQSFTVTYQTGANAQCTASTVPWACCTGSTTGTCTAAAFKTPTNYGNIVTTPAGAASGAVNNSDIIFNYNATATTPQWEYVTQETVPILNVNNLGSVSGAQTCNFALGPICQITASGNLTLTFSNLPTNAPVQVVVGRNAANTGFGITWPSNAIAEVGSNGAEALAQMTGAWTTNAAGAGSGPLFAVYSFWSDGTNAYLTNPVDAIFHKLQANLYSVQSSLTMNAPGATLQFNGDNTVTSMARMPLTFGTGNLTLSGLNGNNFAVYKVVKALTLENIEGVSIVDTSCAAGSVITIYDCGSSAPANAACSGGTAKANVTLSTTVGSAADGTITSANVAAGEYLGAQISTIGTSCTVLNSVVTLMARPQ